MIKKQLLTLMILLMIPVYCHAVSVMATVDRNRISLEDTLTLTVTIDDDKPQVDTSSISDFTIVSQSTGSNFQWINGKTIREFKYHYVLAPLKTGTLSIPSLTVTGNGATYHTKPITVNVSDSPVIDTGGERDLFVKAEISSKDVYIGQQAVYTFAFYHAVQITNASLKRPDFNEFTSKEVDGEKSYRTRINGREYNVIEKQVVLVPAATGDITIPPSVLTCDVVIRVNPGRRDPFDSFFNDSFFGRTKLQRKVLRTEPVSLAVKPLPDYPFDFPFSGVVGSVRFSAELDTYEMSVGDSATLYVTAEGAGNIMDIEEPEINAPDGFKLYKDTPEEEYRTESRGLFGKKVFRFALVAVKPGAHTIPPVRLSYFDVDKGEYQRVAAGPFKIQVNRSDSEMVISDEPEEGALERPKQIKKKVMYTGRDILPVKEDLDSVLMKHGLTFPYYLMLLAFPLLIFIGIRCALMVVGRDKGIAATMVHRAETAYKNASREECSEEIFLANLYKALVSIVFSTASQSGETLTSTEAITILSNSGAPKETIDEAVALLDTIESLRFSGESMDRNRRTKLLEITGRLIKRLRK